jgi:hypothetical protein
MPEMADHDGRDTQPSAASQNKGGVGPTQQRLTELERRLADLPDERTAEVTARYDRKTGKLTVTDDDTGASAVVDAQSGGKPRGDAIPKGNYEILEQARTGQYRLDAVDAKPRNDVHEPTGRDRFRLHGPGRTIGCIACTDREGWAKIRDIIARTKTTTVTDKSTPWWKFWESDAPIKKYGRLVVE